MNVPGDLRYSKTHEWVRLEGEIATIGITDYAQDALGDVVYIELPEVGAELAAEAVFGAVESVKAASDLFMPLGGTIEAVNSTLIDRPEQINADPYGEGWMLKVRIAGQASLLDAGAYEALVDSVKH